MNDTQRVNIAKQHPASYKALTAFSTEVQETAAAWAWTRVWSNC
ncbi:hypothetical protein [Streptomyces monomycini]|nr:hypothetical protein [Streptomyces monomycini]